MNRGCLYGDGFFETLTWVDESCILLPYHIKRARDTAIFLEMKWPQHWDQTFFDSLINQYTNKHSLKDVVVRITFYRSGGGSYQPKENTIEFQITSRPIISKPTSLPTTLESLISQLKTQSKRYASIYNTLLKPQYALSNYKLISSAFYIKAALALKDSTSDTLVLLNEKQRVCEGLDSNIFIVKHRQLTTPSLTEGCVAGTTRAFLLDSLEIKEDVLTVPDLENADYIFMANAVKGVYPVALI